MYMAHSCHLALQGRYCIQLLVQQRAVQYHLFIYVTYPDATSNNTRYEK